MKQDPHTPPQCSDRASFDLPGNFQETRGTTEETNEPLDHPPRSFFPQTNANTDADTGEFPQSGPTKPSDEEHEGSYLPTTASDLIETNHPNSMTTRLEPYE